ncbi:MAG: pyridoxamine 5'-phosphate oxidase family protein [Acidobacteriota bacterium]
MTDKNPDTVERLYALVSEIETAMLVTRRADGSLVSRPMANQDRAPGADFWFAAEAGSDKVEEIRREPQVNLTYYKDRTREWVSIAGTAEVTADRERIRQLYKPDWKAWFDGAASNDPRAGTPDDPRIVLIGVRATSARYMTVDKPQPVVLFEVAKGILTGHRPDVGEMHQVSGEELRRKSPPPKGA